LLAEIPASAVVDLPPRTSPAAPISSVLVRGGPPPPTPNKSIVIKGLWQQGTGSVLPPRSSLTAGSAYSSARGFRFTDECAHELARHVGRYTLEIHALTCEEL